jgi:hypothetical protein
VTDKDRQSQSDSQPVIASLGSLPNSGRPATGKRDEPWIIGSVTTPIGPIPQVATTLSSADRVGSMKARWNWGRMSYRILPGLYAVGKPTRGSAVFVSANYKMSFDRLRQQLEGIDGWILVIDTKGINVWCAAGKGTFGTAEIVTRVQLVRLNEVVSHRRLILPQLGAPGVAAHEVRRGCGFKVKYGPVRAEDIPAYLLAGGQKTPAMRQVNFPLRDRAVLVPTELVLSLKYAIPVAILLALTSAVGTDLLSVERLMSAGLTNGLMVLLVALAGASLPALLLPWLPGRAFALKGLSVGLMIAAAIGVVAWTRPEPFDSRLSAFSWMLIAPAVVSFLAMNFTGSSTYTSLSGVTKEMRVALPMQIAGAVIGLGLWITGLVI